MLSRIVTDPAAAAEGAVLAILGKPMPALRDGLPPGLPLLDVTRLRAPA